MGMLHRRTTVGRAIGRKRPPKPLRGLRLLERRTAVGRVVKRIGDSEKSSTVTSTLGHVHVPPKAVKSALAAVGGLVGVTAGSAAMSARRRRSEASR
jgi:hypothetical protein